MSSSNACNLSRRSSRSKAKAFHRFRQLALKGEASLLTIGHYLEACVFDWVEDTDRNGRPNLSGTSNEIVRFYSTRDGQKRFFRAEKL